MSNIEGIGLLKMDIWGLRNLTVVGTVQMIRKRHNNDFDIEAISTEDEATYDHLCEGRGWGVSIGK